MPALTNPGAISPPAVSAPWASDRRILNELTGGNAVIVTDVGQHQMVACRYARFNQSRSNITSGGLGTMGFRSEDPQRTHRRQRRHRDRCRPAPDGGMPLCPL